MAGDITILGASIDLLPRGASAPVLGSCAWLLLHKAWHFIYSFRPEWVLLGVASSSRLVVPRNELSISWSRLAQFTV